MTTVVKYLVFLVVVVALGVGLVSRSHPKAPQSGPATTLPPTAPQATGPSAGYKPYSWGYIGCSNTHDTIHGYHALASAKHLFWDFNAPGITYAIENHTIQNWADPNNRIWTAFDQMKQYFNGPSDPPVVWIQLCEIYNRGLATDALVTQMISNLRTHVPTSVVYISPLHSYDPPTVCRFMGPGGQASQHMVDLANAAVNNGLAKAGPGAGGNPNLGPLGGNNLAFDNCHPSGSQHNAGPGEEYLGQQLANFFDNLP